MSTLARRFTIICLIFVIFALLMAAAVANGGHRGGRGAAVDACLFHPALACSVQR
tara:strand:- start:933 stop:1097 length:165 start_codon:yes stop_codon:yes gene_type:complete